MVGIDIIEIEEISSANLEVFINKYFTDKEREYVNLKTAKEQTIAGLFCAKEAFLKSFGLGLGEFALSDIEILHTSSGAPFVNLNQKVKNLLKTYNCKAVDLSISHSKHYATAVCVVH